LTLEKAGFPLVSNRRIKDILGWRQTVTLEQSLRDTIAAIRARGPNRG
jgi:nucleoside-diphosphate-sugar epimerase